MTKQKKLYVFMFLALFVAQIVLFYYLYNHPAVVRLVFSPLADMYARISGSILSVAGFPNVVIGDIISSGASFSVGVKKGCDAAEPMAIFIAGILAFRAGIKHKLTGLGAGLLLLFVLNIIRIVSLYIAGIHFPQFFESMHLGVWQVIFLMVAILSWLFWLNRLPARPANS